MGLGQQSFYRAAAYGHKIRLPGFGGIIVVDDTGTMHFDGDYQQRGQKAIDSLMQHYAEAAAEEVFEPQGYNIEKETLEDGSRKLVLTLGGGYSAGPAGEAVGGGYGIG